MRWQIVLPHVHAGGAAQAGEIGPVVHNHRGARRQRSANDVVAQAQKGLRRQRLRADLEQARAAIEKCTREGVRPPAGSFARFDVDNGVKP